MSTPDERPIAAVLEHLTGRCRGQFSWITSRAAEAWLSRTARFSITEPGAQVPDAEMVARFRRDGDTFTVEATDACQLWVNRNPVDSADLHHGDMVEFGENGPLSRIRIYGDTVRPNLTVSEIVGDTRSYLRTSRRSVPRKWSWAAFNVLRRMLFETTVLFRTAVVVALGAILFLLIWQWQIDEDLRADLTSGNLQVDALASAVDETRREALRPSDLAALREDFQESVSDTDERLETLEAQRTAASAVIEATTTSVAFIQASFGLQHKASGRMLRQRLGADGLPMISRNGTPLLTLEGDGPVAEAQITGTGFLLRDTGYMVTNRHVALPWEGNSGGDANPEEMEPVMIRFHAYFPGQTEAIKVRTEAVSDTVDLALLRLETEPEGVAGIDIATAAPRPGEAIIVMGYPTGLRSLLAQSGDDFVRDLQESGETGFWEVAARLAAARLIAPLSTRGIVGRASVATVVYDAETTHGGSGGPVLNMGGAVVAVNTAIIPEFGGSNLGVPGARIRDLLGQLENTQ